MSDKKLSRLDWLMIPLTAISLGLCGYAVLRPGGVIADAYDSFRARVAFRRTLRHNWPALTRTAIAVRPASGPVLVEFGDYECPYCRADQAHLDSLLMLHREVTLLFEQLPLPMHPRAIPAAVASLCAARMGDGMRMHDYLFGNTEWEDARFHWEVAARAARIADIPAFMHCLKSDGVKATLATSMSLADSLQIEATPTFVSRRGLHEGMASEEQLAELAGLGR